MFKKSIILLLTGKLLLASAVIIASAVFPTAYAWADSDGNSDGDSGSDSGGGESESGGASESGGQSDGNSESASGHNSFGGNNGRPSGGEDNAEARKLDAVRLAVEKKQILPLSRVKAEVRTRYGGQIINVEIERSWFHWIYEFKLVNRKGRLIKIRVDARSGRVLNVEND